MKPEEFFKTKQQLERFLYCKELAGKLIEYQNKGFLILDEDNVPVNGKFIFNSSPEDGDWDIFSTKTSNCIFAIVDIEWGEDPWVRSKLNIKKAFDHYRIVEPKHITKLKL